MQKIKPQLISHTKQKFVFMQVIDKYEKYNLSEAMIHNFELNIIMF